jgi:prepilin-type N-terminal cleavage/methylation domain-containing protein
MVVKTKAFTLIELLVVVAIIGILAANGGNNLWQLVLTQEHTKGIRVF